MVKDAVRDVARYVVRPTIKATVKATVRLRKGRRWNRKDKALKGTDKRSRKGNGTGTRRPPGGVQVSTWKVADSRCSAPGREDQGSNPGLIVTGVGTPRCARQDLASGPHTCSPPTPPAC